MGHIEVNCEDAAEELEEATPPPSFASRRDQVVVRRESVTSPPPPLMPGFHPVWPTCRSSTQTVKSAGSGDSGSSPSLSHLWPHFKYLIVDEPQNLDEVTSPSRRPSWALYERYPHRPFDDHLANKNISQH